MRWENSPGKSLSAILLAWLLCLCTFSKLAASYLEHLACSPEDQQPLDQLREKLKKALDEVDLHVTAHQGEKASYNVLRVFCKRFSIL